MDLLQTIQQEVEHALARAEQFRHPLRLFTWSQSPRTPYVDIYDEGGQFVILVELPGVSRSDIEVSIEGSDIVIREDSPGIDEDIRERSTLLLERGRGPFARRVTLPAQIDTDGVAARYHEGLLEVRADKLGAQTPRRRHIPIEPGAELGCPPSGYVQAPGDQNSDDEVWRPALD